MASDTKQTDADDTDAPAQDLSEVLDQSVENTDGDKVTVEELLDSIEHRSFGPLLLLPAVVTVSPLGAIPGVPAVAGVVIVLIAAQVLIGKSQPWIPRKLLDLECSRSKWKDGVEKFRPSVKWCERVVHQRLSFLCEPPVIYLIAMLCIVLSISFVPLEFIPFAVMVPGAAVTLLALGVTAKDGVVVIVGFMAALATGWVTIALWPF